MSMTIRSIRPEDNVTMAVIIRKSLTEFGLNIPGTAYFDKSTDSLYESFQQAGSSYFIAEEEGRIIGGAGIFPTEGLPADTVELVKMYIIPEYRGRGLGRLMMQACIDKAAQLGYATVYLETMPALASAVVAYEKMGFKRLSHPLGNTGHFATTIWMTRPAGQ